MSEPAAPADTPDVAPEIPPPIDSGTVVGAVETAEGLLNGAFFNSIEDLLQKLVPSNDVVVKDCWGKETRLPSALPARRQIKVFRIFKDISEMPAVLSVFDGEMSTDAGSIIDIIIQMASDEEVANRLGDAFSTAHPDVCGDKDPLDVFPIEELLAGLIPFFIRFLHRGVGAMGAVGTVGANA